METNGHLPFSLEREKRERERVGVCACVTPQVKSIMEDPLLHLTGLPFAPPVIHPLTLTQILVCSYTLQTVITVDHRETWENHLQWILQHKIYGRRTGAFFYTLMCFPTFGMMRDFLKLTWRVSRCVC